MSASIWNPCGTTPNGVILVQDPPAIGATNYGPYACGSVAVQIVAALANRETFQVTNLGPDPVTIGVTGMTWAKRVIILNIGDLWIEDRAANLAWTAITDAAKTASVTVQEVTI